MAVSRITRRLLARRRLSGPAAGVRDGLCLEPQAQIIYPQVAFDAPMTAWVRSISAPPRAPPGNASCSSHLNIDISPKRFKGWLDLIETCRGWRRARWSEPARCSRRLFHIGQGSFAAVQVWGLSHGEGTGEKSRLRVLRPIGPHFFASGSDHLGSRQLSTASRARGAVQMPFALVSMSRSKSGACSVR
jgi:hypothetical protein